MSWNRAVLEEVQPSDPYGDQRIAVWPDQPEEPVDYIIIGEAPGKNEVKKGQVFCGRSGQLLREMVEEAGLGKVHYTNTSLFRPTKGTTGKDKPPAIALVRKERSRLLLEISMLKPKALICVGVTAAEALLGNVPRMRGMVRELRIHGRTYLVYLTHHPAYILYEPDMYRDVVEDFERAKNLETPERFIPADVQYQRGDDSPFTGGYIAVDAEASSTYIPGASLLTCSVADAAGVRIYTPETLPALARALDSFKGRVIGHNAPFDEQLLRQSGVPIVFTDDTLLLHYSQDERKGTHKLKTLGPSVAKRDTGIDLVWPYIRRSTSESDDEDNEQHGWSSIPQATLEQYCGRDSEVTRSLYERLRERDRTDDRSSHVYSLLQRGLRAFTGGMSRGVTVNRALLVEETAKQEEIVASLLKEFDFNPESYPQTIAAFRAAGYDIDSAAKDILRDLEGDLPRKMEQFREQNKLLKGFLRPLQEWSGIDGKAHPTYKLFGTDSGRTSCADPNLQQVPPELRHLFVARPGHVFIGWDFRTHEVRGVGLLSKDARLLEMLRDPTADPHQIIAGLVNIPRQTAKHCLFGVIYGAGVAKLVKAHGISPEVAQHATGEIRKLFPGLDIWRESVVEQMYEQGYVETPYYHRRRHFLYMDDKTAYHQERVAINFLPQSLCADVALDSAISVYEELGYEPLIFVHDFNAIEVPEDRADTAKDYSQEIASALCPNEYVQFIPDMKMGYTWGDMKNV